MTIGARIDLDKPLYVQTTFIGRLKHFFWVTDPRTCVCSEETLDNAKNLIVAYRQGKEPQGTSTEQIIFARKLYESAFHPDTGDKQNVFGRMSFQVPGGMAITGFMLQFYRTVPAVVFWQWVNQSFNALVNYTNRNAKSQLSTTQLGIAYVSATTSALVTAIGFRSFLEKRAGTLLQRYVPFAAVAAANCVNIPLMRQNELVDGVDVFDENGNLVGQSRIAAAKGISQVVFSRIAMAAPGMTILPIVMQKLETYNWMQRIRVLHAPLQVLMVGCFLTFMVPTACALFPQRCSLSMSMIERFESDSYKKMLEKCNGQAPRVVFFNKGL
ncbi:sideroflexin-2 [Neocloeon triangulifer]|uniref:sideroflexin-2 n=1 Tax=Neocloeon triangulifer TaxID=2078957 RepID=UPI00286EFBFF|nr:sideroflexin-2 [Neocloeon triangulifer]